MTNNYLSIDIGGTNIKYGVIDHSGTMISKDKIATPANDKDVFLRTIFNLISVNYPDIKGVALSCPGKIETDTGTVYFGGSLPFLDGVSFKQLIHEKYPDLLIAVTNDGKAAALAEKWLGVLRDHPNSAAIVLGTGVGGGIIVNNQLLPGAHFQAGELSMMINDQSASGLDELVGFNGSAVNLVANIAHKLSLPDDKDGIAAFKYVHSENPIALRALHTYCRRIAVLILNIQTVVDLTRFAIGGGISGDESVVPAINTAYDALLTEFPLIANTFSRPEIVRARFGNDANLYGALYGLLLDVNDEILN
jgi:predicted NBD/HSP70 family sugar kinase